MSKRAWIVLIVLVLLLGGGVVAVKVATTQTEAQKLAALLPQVRAAFERLRSRLAAQGIRLLVGQTRRTADQQAAIYAAGNSGTTKSWHLLGRAVDVYVYGPDGKPDMDGRHVELYRKLHTEAAREGFRGLAFNADGSKRYITNAQGKPVWDAGHIEFPEGMTWAAAAKAAGVKVA